MNSDTKSRRIWPRPSFLIVVGVLVLISLFMRFANPQWNRYIYMFQSYIWPGQDRVSPPEDYTGMWRTWYSNGKRCSIHFYENGNCRFYVQWFPHGKKMCEEYEDGENGTYIYYSGGRKWQKWYSKQSGTLKPGGRLHGRRTQWHPNGQKEYEQMYQNGKEHGKLVRWRSNGQKWFEANYDNDKLHGKETRWDKDGKILYVKIYQDGKVVSIENNAEQTD